MKKIKISPRNENFKQVQDKTDWVSVYKKSQTTVDREAAADQENPILKNARFSRMNKNSPAPR